MSSFNYCFRTCNQVSQETGKGVWYFHLLKNFPQFIVIHTVKGFSIVNEAEVGVLLEFSCLFNDPVDVGNLISGSSAFSKSILNIWKFLVHVLLKPDLENFEHYFASMWAGRLQSMGSLKVRHDWVTSLSLLTFMHWRRKWQPTPVFLPGESQERGSLMGCHLWGRTESDMTEVT